MAKNIKTVHKRFDYRQCDDFAAYLNYMARLGWHFKEFRSGLVFEKGEPENAVYAVEVFPDGTEYDTRPSYQAEVFGEYCEAAGWQLMDQRAKWCVFKRIREDAVPILTDAERLENVSALEPTFLLKGRNIYPFVLLLCIWNFLTDLEQYIFSTLRLFLVAYVMLSGLENLYRSLEFSLWRKRSLARIERGEKVFFGRKQHPVLRFAANGLMCLIQAGMVLFALRAGQYGYLVIILALIGITTVTTWVPARFRWDTTSNQLLRVLLIPLALLALFSLSMFRSAVQPPEAQATPPLQVQDLHPGQEADDTEVTFSDSIFGSKLYCHLEFGDQYLFYRVYTSEYHWILDLIWAQETKQSWTDCTGLWDSEEALRTGSGKYWVRYENMLLELRPGGEDPLTAEQVALIREKLGLR